MEAETNPLEVLQLCLQNLTINKSGGLLSANGAIQTSVNLSSVKAGLYFVRFDKWESRNFEDHETIVLVYREP